MKASDLAPEILTPYDTRHVPKPVPTPGIFDCPTVPLCINSFWVSHLDGLLERLIYRDAWIGTNDEVDRAIGEINKLLGALKENNMSCCCDDTQVILHRVNPDTGRPEISTDGGATWKPDPNDPQFSVIQYPPPVTAGVSATKCDAATNGKEHISDLIAGYSANLGTAISVFDFAVAVAGIILTIVIGIITGGAGAPVATTIAALIWGAASAAFSAGKTAFDDYWTEEKKDKILCALYCTIGEDGSFTDAEYNAFIAKYKADVGTDIAANAILSAIQATGKPGLNNMCAYGNAADADCSSCACGCNYSTWDVWIAGGTLDTRDADHISIIAIDGGDGHWYASVKSAGINDCCCFATFTYDPAISPEVIGGNPCGQSQADESNLSFDVGDGSYNAFAFRASEAFTVTISSTDDCP